MMKRPRYVINGIFMVLLTYKTVKPAGWPLPVIQTIMRIPLGFTAA